MAVEVKHATQATGTPAGNGEIAKDEWNEAHTVTGLGTMAEEDAADYYTKTEADAAFAPQTLMTQGDLLYHDGTGHQRLAAGVSGQVLRSGGEGANPSWADLLPAPGAGNINIANAINSTWGITSLSAADKIIYVPLWNFRRRVVSGLGCRISAGVADSNLKIGIFGDSGSFAPAGAALGETGNISAASATTVVAALSGSNFVMEALTWYWAAYWWSASGGRLVGNQQANYWSQFYGSATAGDLIQTGNSTGYHYESDETFAASFPNASSESLSKVTTATRIWEPALLIDEA